MRVIGLAVLIALWPNFNYTTAIIDSSYLPIKQTASLKEEGFLQMILGFCAAICTTLGLRIFG